MGRHETYSIEDVPGTDYDSRHGSRDPGAQWRSVPPPSDDTYGVPDRGALERDQLRLQSQPLLTPGAQSDGVWTGVAALRVPLGLKGWALGCLRLKRLKTCHGRF